MPHLGHYNIMVSLVAWHRVIERSSPAYVETQRCMVMDRQVFIAGDGRAQLTPNTTLVTGRRAVDALFGDGLGEGSRLCYGPDRASAVRGGTPTSRLKDEQALLLFV